MICENDCDDDDAGLNPAAPELCDGIDNNCNGVIPADEVDGDADGFMACDGDCDDDDADVNPGAVEVCDGVDNNCQGIVDEGCSCDATVPGDHATIQDAIDSMADGTLICVEAGVYYENLDFGGAELRVLGVEGPENTIIDGQSWDSVAVFESGEGPDAVLEGFTLTHGAFSWGGGVRIGNASDPTLTDLVIEDSSATQCGGGLYVLGETSGFTDLIVRNNTAQQGGGICVDGVVVMEGSEISGNTSTSHGGGAWIEGHGDYAGSGEALYLYDSSVSSNVAGSSGGGIYNDGSILLLSRVDVVDNQAGSSHNGGGVRCVGELLDPHWGTTDVCYLYADDVRFQGNTARYGGAVWADRWDGTFRNTWFVENQAVRNGGGFYDGLAPPHPAPSYEWENVVMIGNEAGYDGGAVYLESGHRFDNTLFANNRAGGDGGGIGGDSGSFTNCVFVGNEAGTSGGAMHGGGNVDYSNAWGNLPDNYGNMVDPTGVDGNTSVDPELMDQTAPDPYQWNVHLGDTSPLIGAGDPSLANPDGSNSDMGAYGGPGADSNDLDWDGYDEWWLPGAFDPVTSPGMDCDDRDATVYPGAPEVCDGLDNDCDGVVPADEADADADGFRICEDDCDDADADVNPGAVELCDGIDNDCDGVVDGVGEDDLDGDGFSPCDGDCDDDDAAAYPGAPEQCDGIDNDCDGAVPADEEDADGDGSRICDGDCDDDDPALDPLDDDGDGYSPCDGDCDDDDEDANPAAVEDCNGVDDDCDGDVDEGCGCDVAVPGDHATIQDAIDAAANGSRICVAAGTYTENIDFGGAEVHLYGSGGPDVTILDGGAAGSVVSFLNGEGNGAVLEGFTITHGYANYGAGILVIDSSPTLQDLVVTESHADYDGGGIYLDGAAAVMGRITLSDNGEIWSGATGLHAVDSVLDIDRMDFIDHFHSLGFGGLEVRDCDGTIRNVRIEGNFAGNGGGGYLQGATLLQASHFFVSTNGTDGTNGGMYVGANVEFTNSIIKSNAGWGVGGLYVYDGGVVRNVVVEDNDSHDYGTGGAHAADGATLINVAVSRNESDGDSGGLSVSGTIDLLHCTLWDNVPNDYDGIPNPYGVDGNLNEDPLFLGGDDYHIDALSGLVDAGDPSWLDPDGSPSDIGAFGGPDAGGWDLDWDGFPAWWQPGAYDHANYPDLGWDCDDRDATVYPGNGC